MTAVKCQPTRHSTGEYIRLLRSTYMYPTTAVLLLVSYWACRLPPRDLSNNKHEHQACFFCSSMPFTTQSCCASTEHRVRATTGPERFGQSQHVPATRSFVACICRYTYIVLRQREKSCSTAVRGCMHDARVVRGEATTCPGSRKVSLDMAVSWML